jgi:thiol-disulfide isomerase/thioredoxin
MNLVQIKRFFVVSFFLFIGGCATMQAPSKITGQEVPFTKFTRLDGSYLMTDELRGKTVVLVFWASWCQYSRPAIIRIDEYAKNKLKRDDVVFLGVSLDKATDFKKLEEVISYLKTEKFEYFFSGNESYDEAFMAFDGGMLPHIFIINPEGKVVIDGHKDSIIYEYFGVPA